ncbi:MAG: hypothetical protein MZV70_20875 [Desulfobacterales bacterium]|nr:hypothetical protein [Desulfobacterales bacterium]
MMNITDVGHLTGDRGHGRGQDGERRPARGPDGLGHRRVLHPRVQRRTSRG